MSERPRIVLYSAFLSPFRSGAEAMVEEVSVRLSKEYDVTILTSRLRRDLPKQENMRGVTVRRLGFGMSIDKWLFPFLAPLAVRPLRPQLLHAVLESYAGLALVVSRIVVPGVPRLLTCQSTNTSFLVGLMHRSSTAVTCISNVLVERAQKFECKATLIPNGIDYDRLRSAAEKQKRDPHRIVFVGRLEPMKGIDTLLTAFAALPIDGMHLRIVGDGSQRGILEELAQQLGVADRVTFVGKLAADQVAQEYAQATVFCGLSRSEALGNVFLEAQAAGCAVVGTNVGGIPDSVKHEQTGLLVSPDDPTAAAEAIARLLSDDSLRSKLSKNAVAHTKSYDWDGITKQYADVYRLTQ